MELEKLIIESVINSIKSGNVCDTVTVLEMALKLIKGLSAWDAEKALMIIFGGAADAE